MGDELLDELMEEAMKEDSITCPECGEILEPDVDKCFACGWDNPLVSMFDKEEDKGSPETEVDDDDDDDDDDKDKKE